EVGRPCGGFQRGAGAPLCVVAEEGVTGEKPHRKGFSSRAVFWLLFVRTKSNLGSGGGAPGSHRPQPSHTEKEKSPAGGAGKEAEERIPLYEANHPPDCIPHPDRLYLGHRLHRPERGGGLRRSPDLQRPAE